MSETVMPNQIVLIEQPPNKAQLLNDLAVRAGTIMGLDAHELVTGLLRREELGSTGLGGGIAVPHARLPGLNSPFSVLAILHPAIQFDAIDGEPVDIVFLLLTPDNGEALRALANVSRLLRKPDLVAALRGAKSAAAAFEILKP